MVVKMMKWSPWQQSSTAEARKFQVKARGMKLEGFFEYRGDDEREKVMVVEMRWKGGPKPGLVPFHRPSSKRRKQISREIAVKKGESVEWDEEFENACSFPLVPKENTFGPWHVSFTLLYGAKGENKMLVVGKGSLNLGEMVSKMEPVIETKVPINFQVAGVAGEATLSVCFTFLEIRDSQDPPGTVQNSTESKVLEAARGDADGSVDENDRGKQRQKSQESSDDSDESALFDSSECTSENELGATTRRVDIATESGSGLGSETQLDSVKIKAGFFSWKRKRLRFRPGKTKAEPSIKKTRDDVDNDHVDRHRIGSPSIDLVTPSLRPKLDDTEPSYKPVEQEESSSTGHWEEKELISRDGQSKLKTTVFFASFDQRSDKAAGESACTVLVTAITHWLQSNQEAMPTRSEFDQLIIEGSSEWRKLCENQDLINHFPNKHFDLETVLQAGLLPISVLAEKSFVGFFGPEKFESLKGVMSFDQIWDEIKSINAEDNNTARVYIVSWNDHFFVLKVDSDAYYIIDTLGERLYEGCNYAYILKFDNSALMHGKAERERVVGSEETSGGELTRPVEEETEEEICRGKECCREFIKRFFAAIPLRELESEEEKEPVSYFDLHHRLQIEFNFSSSLSSFSSASSLFSD